MTDEPIVWHYGLMAERWAEGIQETPELHFFEKAIGRFGQPVLDVACGTGRLLLPLLRAGIDVDGCDISGDMLHYCRQKATHEGFQPHLHEQPMHSFDMPRRYRTIYICGSFGLAGSRERDIDTLGCCYTHLHKGGALVLNIQAEYTSAESWSEWLPEYRQTLPEAWPEEGKKRVAADGSESVAYFRTVDLDPFEQSYIREVRLEKWVDCAQVAAESYALRGNMYFKNELLLMLKVAGFSEISIFGDFSDEPATAVHEELVFVAVK